ncbi:hypothetical protein [Mycobacteroides abscessus]|nr:hypothetical protein [Mycobacteroides abscessus]
MSEGTIAYLGEPAHSSVQGRAYIGGNPLAVAAHLVTSGIP